MDLDICIRKINFQYVSVAKVVSIHIFDPFRKLTRTALYRKGYQICLCMMVLLFSKRPCTYSKSLSSVVFFYSYLLTEKNLKLNAVIPEGKTCICNFGPKIGLKIKNWVFCRLTSLINVSVKEVNVLNIDIDNAH